MRIGIVGGGLAGTLLAWRLASQPGYLDPDRFRRSLLADLAGRDRVAVLPPGQVAEYSPDGFSVAGERHECDLVVLAAGAWTPTLLSAAGFDAGGLTTKSIQYTI